MSRSAALLASLLATLGRPTWSVLALAGFLVRGGIVLFLVPIVSLPSPLALSNDVAPLINEIRFAQVGPERVAQLVTAGLAGVTWLLLGGLLGAAIEVVLIREAAEAATEEGVPGGGGPESSPAVHASGRRLAARVLVVRLVTHLPLLIAMLFGAVRIIDVTYIELTTPADVTIPLVVRVLVSAALPIGLIIAAWFLGELAGGLAARRIVLEDASAGAAIVGAGGALVRGSGTALVPVALTSATLLATLALTLIAAGTAWTRVRGVLAAFPTGAAELAVALVTFVAIWLAALGLTGLLAAWRGASMTFETVRQRGRVPQRGPWSAQSVDRDTGTFGAS